MEKRAESKISLNFEDEPHDNTLRETATTKFVIVVTIFGIIFFIVLYLIIILKNTNQQIPSPTIQVNNTDDLSQAESLISSERAAKIPPRPFINNFRGPPPASFHPTRPRPTELVYPQLQSYNPAMHLTTPHNIQDIIGFIMPNNVRNVNNNVNNNANNNLNNGKGKHFINSHHDPFYSYKPKDPSDINLLATANLRFAPPAWKDLKTNPVSSSSSLRPHGMHAYEYELPQSPQSPMSPGPQQTKNSARALTLSLNVFPIANDPYKENFYAVSGAQPISNTRNRMKTMSKPRKMIIHLNLYSNEALMMNREDISDDNDYEIERNLIEKNIDGLQEMLNINNKN